LSTDTPSAASWRPAKLKTNEIVFATWIAFLVPTLLVQRGFTITQSLEVFSLIAICNPVGAWLGTLR
jgi:hypothetical protein